MASYLEEYKALDTVPQQKASLYQYLSDNRSSLGMTPDEEYKFNWGQEALSEDWMTKKAQEIQKNVEAANSTSILRRGLGKGDVAKTTEEEVAEKTSADTTAPKTAGIEVNGSGGDGPSFGGAQEAGNVYGIGSEFDSDAAKTGAKAGSFFGIPGAIIGGTIGGFAGGYKSPETIAKEVAQMDAMLSARDASHHAPSTTLSQMNSMQSALVDDNVALNAMRGYGSDSDGNNGADRSADSDRDHGNSGSAPGGGA